ncbi:hypothetical protein [Dyadobacter helix]|nr:hypothetical protein [Dyadobacter sp. CECT 9275]
MTKDQSSDRPFKRAVLRDRGGDLTKEWYVEYYAYDESVGDLVRKRVNIPTSFQTKKARMAEAVRLIAEINQLPESGHYFINGSTTRPGLSPIGSKLLGPYYLFFGYNRKYVEEKFTIGKCSRIF